MCYINHVYWCYFWLSSPLCCPRHPTFLSVRPLVVPEKERSEMSCYHYTSLWARRTTHPYAHREYTLIPAEKTKQCLEICSNSCLSDGQSLCQCCTFNKWLFLCVSVQWHKRTTRVCVREVITAFQRFFYSIHTQIRVYWHSGAVKSHKHTKKHKVATHREHGKVSDHFKSDGRGFRQLDSEPLPAVGQKRKV